MIIVGAGALVLILFIINLGISSSNRKLKKGIKTIKEDKIIDKLVKEEKTKEELPEGKEKKVEEVTPKVEEKSIEENNSYDEEVPRENLSKKELKRLKKEEKRRLKEMADDFLS